MRLIAAARTGDGVEEPPRCVAAESDRQNDEEQLPSGAGLQLLKGAGAARLGGRTSVPGNVEGEVRQKQIDDTPGRNPDSSDRVHPTANVVLGGDLDPFGSQL